MRRHSFAAHVPRISGAPVHWLTLSGIVLLLSLSLLAAAEIPVYVTVSVKDKNLLPFENLAAADFRVLENDKPRPIEVLASNQMETVFGLLYERALIPSRLQGGRLESLAGGLPPSRELAYGLIDKYLGRQALWVGVYDRELEVVLDFGNDGFQAKAALQRLTGPRNPQDGFLYGALVASLAKMNTRNEKRRILLIFLQSADAETTSRMKPLKNLVSASNVELFFVSFSTRLGSGTSLPPMLNQAILRELSQLTAGDVYFMTDFREHPEDLLRQFDLHLRSLYTFGFASQTTLESPGKVVVECLRDGCRTRHRPVVPLLR